MSKNKVLHDAIKGTAKWRGADEAVQARRFAALDALIDANLNDAKDFRQKIIAHIALWTSIDPKINPDNATWSGWVMNAMPTFLGGTSVNPLENDVFLDSTDLVDSFQKIQQDAVEQRVKLGVEKADINVLVNILQNNTEDCRAYLASRAVVPDCDALNRHSENQDLTAELNNLLTDEAVNNIKALAAKAIQGASLLRKTLSAHTAATILPVFYANDLNTFHTELLNLYPGHGDIRLLATDENLQELKDLMAPNVLKLAQAALGNLSADELRNLSNATDLATFKVQLSILVSPNFPANLKGVLSELTEADRTLVRQANTANVLVLARTALGNLSADELNNLSTANDLAAFKEQLSQLVSPNFPANLNGVISNLTEADRTLVLARTALGNLSADELNNLSTANDLAAFKEQLSQLVSPNFPANLNGVISNLTEADRTLVLARTALGNLSADELNNLSTANDLAAFKEQLSILVSPNFPDNLKGVISELTEADRTLVGQANAANVFSMLVASTSRLGVGAHPQLMAVFATLSASKQLEIISKPEELPHVINATAPEVIARYWGEGVDAKSILKENEKNNLFKGIYNSAIAEKLANLQFDTLPTSEQINAINTALAAKRENQLDEATVRDILTTLTPLNNLIILAPDSVAAINAAHQKNKFIFEELRFVVGRDNINPLLLKRLLTIDKDTAITKEQISIISDMFRKTEDVGKFINGLSNDPAQKQKLANELTAAVFLNIKDSIRANDLLSTDATTADNVVKQIKAVVETLSKSREPMEAAYSDKLDLISKIHDFHLYSPAFQTQAKKDPSAMKNKYEPLSEQADLTVKHLERNRSELKRYLASVPYDEQDPKMAVTNSLHKELTAELKATEKLLEKYVVIKEKLSGRNGILNAIDAAVNGSKHYVYQQEGVSSAIISREALKSYQRSDNDNGNKAPSNVEALDNNDPGTVAAFLLEDKPKPGEVRCFDVVYKPKDLNTEIAGRFIYDPHAITSSGNQGKGFPGKFSVEQFPQKAAGVSDVHLQAARVNFAMAFAAQILANLDSLPSKDKPLYLNGGDKDQQSYIWTALIILGEKSPNMKFDASAIAVRNSTFKPEEQKGMLYGYATHSLYNTAFAGQKKEKVVSDVQSFTKERLAPDNATPFRKELNEQKNEFANKRKGPEPELEPIAPVPGNGP